MLLDVAPVAFDQEFAGQSVQELFPAVDLKLPLLQATHAFPNG